MAFIIDTEFLYATLDKRDKHHKNVMELLPNLPKNDLILPTLVLVELTYFLQKRLGHKKMRLCISTLDNSPIKFENITQDDIHRIYELLNQYSNIKLDFVDASITAIAERLNIKQILTVDKRDFNIICPTHCKHFEILPQ